MSTDVRGEMRIPSMLVLSISPSNKERPVRKPPLNPAPGDRYDDFEGRLIPS
jgi:hypothetical protein